MPIDPPQVIETSPVQIAFISLQVPSAEIREHMGRGLQELHAELAKQGISASGPWFTHHRKPPGVHFDYEICLPVAKAIQAAGRVQAGTWPAMKVARTVYRGGFEGLGAAWAELRGWVKTAGLERREDLYEVYLSGPDADPDPATYQTELSQPLER